MTKKEFLEGLRRELNFLSEYELNDAIRYYDEYISEAGDDEEKIIETIGSPEKAAEEFRREYYDKGETSPDVPAVSAEKRYIPFWPRIIIYAAVIIIALSIIIHIIPSIVGVCVILLAAFIIIKTVKDKSDKTVIVNTSGINSRDNVKAIKIILHAGNFEIMSGNGFDVDTSGAKRVNISSFVKDGVWRVETEKIRMGGDTGIVRITVPYGFKAEDMTVHAHMGNISINELSADKLRLSVDMGKCVISKMLARDLDIHCGMGEISGDCKADGNIGINCGMGNVRLHLKNKRKEFNYRASVGIGSVDIDGEKINGAAGRSSADNGAARGINIKCGMGNVKVLFDD